MPTNAEIHATIDLLIRQPKSSILTNSIADMLDDMVDNIAAGAGTPNINQVLTSGNEAGGLEILGVSVIGTEAGGGLILEAPDTGRWLVTVDNAGALQIVSV